MKLSFDTVLFTLFHVSGATPVARSCAASDARFTTLLCASRMRGGSFFTRLPLFKLTKYTPSSSASQWAWYSSMMMVSLAAAPSPPSLAAASAAELEVAPAAPLLAFGIVVALRLAAGGPGASPALQMQSSD